MDKDGFLIIIFFNLALKVSATKYIAKPLSTFHQINAYEKDGLLILDMCASDDGQAITNYNIQNLRKSGEALDEVRGNMFWDSHWHFFRVNVWHFPLGSTDVFVPSSWRINNILQEFNKKRLHLELTYRIPSGVQHHVQDLPAPFCFADQHQPRHALQPELEQPTKQYSQFCQICQKQGGWPTQKNMLMFKLFWHLVEVRIRLPL